MESCLSQIMFYICIAILVLAIIPMLIFMGLGFFANWVDDQSMTGPDPVVVISQPVESAT